MAINYAIKRCPNPNGIEGVDYYAPRVIKVDDYTVEELVTDIDVRAVLSALGKQIRKGLLSGRTVVLEGVGRVSVGLKTRCFTAETMNSEGFTPAAMIKEVHINFRPDAGILGELRMKKSLRRVASEVMD